MRDAQARRGAIRELACECMQPEPLGSSPGISEVADGRAVVGALTTECSGAVPPVDAEVFTVEMAGPVHRPRPTPQYHRHNRLVPGSVENEIRSHRLTPETPPEGSR